MNPNTARWFLERIDAYLNNPDLAKSKYYLDTALFLKVINNLGFEPPFKNLQEAKEFCEAVINNLPSERSIPDPQTLRSWQEELEKAQNEKRQINEKVVLEIRADIEKLKQRQAFIQKIQVNLGQTGNKTLLEERQTSQEISRRIGEAFLQRILQNPQEVTREKYPTTLAYLRPQIDQILREKGVFLPPETIQTFLEKTAGETLEEASFFAKSELPPTPIVPLAGPTRPGPGPTAPEITIFTPEVKENFTGEEEGLAIVPLYTLFNPRAASSFIKKVALAPIVKSLQFLDNLSGDQLQKEIAKDATKKEAVLLWREKLHQGLGSADLQESYDALSSAGVPHEAPQMKALEEKRSKMKEYERAHPRMSRLLDHYHQFTKITGRRQIFAKEIQTFLPRLSPVSGWFSKIGKTNFSFRLKRFFDGLGSRLFFYEKKTLVSGKTIIYFALPDKLTRLVTLGRVQSFAALKTLIASKTIKPLAAALGKTAAGQAVKKGAAWLVTRLGLAAIPSGVTQAIAVGWIALDAIRLFFSKQGREILKKILLFGLGIILAIGGLLVAFPVSILFFAFSFLILGAAAFGPVFLAGIISGVGAATSGGIGMIGGIILLLTLSPLGAFFGAILIGVFAGIIALAFFIVILTAGAFIGQPAPIGLPSALGSRFIEIVKTAQFEGKIVTSLPNEALSESSTLTYNLTVTARDRKLTNIIITDDTMVTTKDESFKITKDATGKAIERWTVGSLDPGKQWQQTYTISIPKSRFEDSMVANIVRVSAQAPKDGGGTTMEEKYLSYSVMIGNPPITLFSILEWAGKITNALLRGIENFWCKLLETFTSGSYNTGTWPAYSDPTRYWCTYLIIDAYNLAGFSGLAKSRHAAVVNMENWWRSAESQGLGYRYVDYRANPQNLRMVQPGYAMFAYSIPGVYTGYEHVSLVRGVYLNEQGDGYIESYEANAQSKTWVYPVSGWKINYNIANYIVTGFGGR